MSTAARARPPIDARIRDRRRQVAREQARRRRRVTVSVAAAAGLLAGVVALTYTPLFAVADVDVVGVTGDREQEVRSVAGVVVGERLLGVDLDRVAGDVEGLAWVARATVARRPPSTVAITVEPRTPVAVVRVGQESWLVDADAVVVGGGAADDLVTIDAPEAVLPGSGATMTDPVVRNALEAHRALPDRLRAAVVRYDAPSVRGLRALLAADVLDHAAADGLWVRLGNAERMDAKARVVELLVEQIAAQADRLDGTAVAELDVRAPDNPVVIPRR